MSGESWEEMAARGRARDLADMRRALRFCAAMLRAELGEGGVAEEHERAGVEFAARWLEGTSSDSSAHPNIALYEWRLGAHQTVIVDDPVVPPGPRSCSSATPIPPAGEAKS